MKLQEQYAKGRRFVFRTQVYGTRPVPKRAPIPTQLRIFFAATTKRSPGHMVTRECGVENYLLSYYDLKKEPDNYIERFIKRGPLSSKQLTYNQRRISHLLEEHLRHEI